MRKRRPSFGQGFPAAVMAAALVTLIACPPTIAHPPNSRTKTQADRIGSDPAGSPRTATRVSAGDEPPFDAAMRLFFCQEAGDAIRREAPSEEIRQWILIHGHHCPEEQRRLFVPPEF